MQAVSLINEAVGSGARLFKACEVLDISVRTYRRWRDNPAGDKRRGPLTVPANKFSEEEKKAVIKIANSKEYRDLPPSQIVPRLADQGKYFGSESTFYRILREEEMLAHRGKANIAVHKRPLPLVARGPNEVWSWDISYLKSTIQGIFFYAYIILDVFSRKIVAGDVFETESSEYASWLVKKACLWEGAVYRDLVLHADNGGPMKGATLLATLQKLGVMPSFSRPKVSDDNPYSEALFRTLKYCPEFPSKPFQSVEEARAWLRSFIYWYNNCHLHSGIKFVTPADKHAGRDVKILEARKVVYEAARLKNPNRWSGEIRNWDPITEVFLNPLKKKEGDDMKIAA